MGSLRLILVIFVLLSHIPPVRSGMNIYIKRLFSSCWVAKGVCRSSCSGEEFFHILCGTHYVCCINKKDMPTLFVK
ncbi:beta-defensin 135 [Meriones unguiculatus]|uniref:beta-defensin 135 n=1 Tax=Meriones unguiculatus TaxID=10047 RepID=UPI000B4FC2F9|nr:beta-defensin 135 [Meriones unguiculatus]